jgi:hypothetical protein
MVSTVRWSCIGRVTPKLNRSANLGLAIEWIEWADTVSINLMPTSQATEQHG